MLLIGIGNSIVYYDLGQLDGFGHLHVAIIVNLLVQGQCKGLKGSFGLVFAFG